MIYKYLIIVDNLLTPKDLGKVGWGKFLIVAVTAANNFIFDLPKKKEHFHFWGAWSHEKYDILKYILLKKKRENKEEKGKKR